MSTVVRQRPGSNAALIKRMDEFEKYYKKYRILNSAVMGFIIGYVIVELGDY
jgi:hypothetical protein